MPGKLSAFNEQRREGKQKQLTWPMIKRSVRDTRLCNSLACNSHIALRIERKEAFVATKHRPNHFHC